MRPQFTGRRRGGQAGTDVYHQPPPGWYPVRGCPWNLTDRRGRRLRLGFGVRSGRYLWNLDGRSGSAATLAELWRQIDAVLS